MTPPQGRASTRRQKLEFVGRLYDVWLTMPDLRLGQLIYNATGGKDIFNDEDFPLLETLEKWVAELGEHECPTT